ncbi:MAG: hypothetical protein LBO79_06405 [Zoogloeaceae bacterium]|nr:hypothetical protein [Zoogloeaceae bacterium]
MKACRAGIPQQQIADIIGYYLNSMSRWIREFEREERLEAPARSCRF